MVTLLYPRDSLTDGLLSLRKYAPGDACALYAAVNESIAQLTQWGFYHPGFTLEDAAADAAARIADWNAGHTFTYLIEQRSGPGLVGNCRIEELEPEQQQAALGWWVRSSLTGRGLATAAARLVAQAAFEDLQLSALHIYTRVENAASRRVAEKLGALLVEIRPEPDGRCCAVYALQPANLR